MKTLIKHLLDFSGRVENITVPIDSQVLSARINGARHPFLWISKGSADVNKKINVCVLQEGMEIPNGFSYLDSFDNLDTFGYFTTNWCVFIKEDY